MGRIWKIIGAYITTENVSLAGIGGAVAWLWRWSQSTRMDRLVGAIQEHLIAHYDIRGYSPGCNVACLVSSGFRRGYLWGFEAEARKAKVRSVQVRTGVVLSQRGGALQQMLLPFKAFVGGPIGRGKQWFPWIHMADEVAAILFCIDRESLAGPVNLVAPGLVTMKEFAQALGRALHRPSWAPVPLAALRIAVGEVAEVLASGQRAVPRKLLESGFQFRYPELAPALADLLR